MAKVSLIGSVLKEAGIITIDGRRCVCGSCKATGRIDTLEIKHKKDCTAYIAVKTFIDTLHADENIIPRVELPIELDAMLPYYAELTSEEYAVADGIATMLFAAATKTEREKLKKRITKFEETTNERPDLLEAVMVSGLESNTDRVNFRNWLVFMKVHNRNLSRLEAEHYEMECKATEMQELFDRAFRVGS